MSKLPVTDAKTLEKILFKLGFFLYNAKRQSQILPACRWTVHNSSAPWKFRLRTTTIKRDIETGKPYY